MCAFEKAQRGLVSAGFLHARMREITAQRHAIAACGNRRGRAAFACRHRNADAEHHAENTFVRRALHRRACGDYQVTARNVAKLVAQNADHLAGIFGSFNQAGIDEDVRAARDKGVDLGALDDRRLTLFLSIPAASSRGVIHSLSVVSISTSRMMMGGAAAPAKLGKRTSERARLRKNNFRRGLLYAIFPCICGCFLPSSITSKNKIGYEIRSSMD